MKTFGLHLAILFAAGLNSVRAQDTWTQKANFGGTARYGAVGFSIGSKGFVGTGSSANDFWEYDPVLDVWSQKADFAGITRYFAAGFSIGDKGYLGTGVNGLNNLNDFWEYDPVLNAWTQKADFAGGSRFGAVGFSIGDKGYIGTGNYDDFISNGEFNDFWEYDPESDAWTKKPNFGGTHRWVATGFSIGNKGYLGLGFLDYDFFRDFWEYDPLTNVWTQKADFGGTARDFATGFSIGDNGYVGTGVAPTNHFYEYNPQFNVWIKKAGFNNASRIGAVGFSIGSKGYVGTGWSNGAYLNDFWEYTPGVSSCAVPTNLLTTNITASSAKLKWDEITGGALGYKVRYRVTGTGVWTYHKITAGHSRQLNNLSQNTDYTWEVKTYCSVNPGVSSDWSAKQHFTTAALRIAGEPAKQTLFQIYPNPGGDHATIRFTLSHPSHICIKVYDVSGKEIGALLDAEFQQGYHSLPINTNHFSKGVYTVKMISDFGIANQKLIVQ